MKKKDGSLEDYMSRFLFNFKKSPHYELNEESQNILFIRGIDGVCTKALDIMG